MSTHADRPTPTDANDHTSRRLGLVRASRLAVDRVACTGHGVCAQLLDGVTLDEWGYPLVAPETVEGPEGHAVAETAIRLCPARALYLR
ncbi:ferredoxin [Terrabacter sp. 2RAF25]|uniref:ferredoxin n=1 Tax=Terrabacter sp. 2RAF25 TaxID=3232998 RepID=UPI003F96B6AB